MPTPTPIDELPDLPPLDEEEPEPSPRRRGVRRRRRAVRSSTSSSEGSREGKLKQIGSELDQAFVLIGTALTPILPVTGTTLVTRGPQGSDIVTGIARRDERVYRALVAISKYAVYAELAMFVGTIGIAVSVDLGQQKPDSFIVQRMLGKDWEPIMRSIYERQQQSANGAGPDHSTVAGNPVSAGWGNSTPA